LGHEHLLDSHLLWTILLDYLSYRIEDNFESLGQLQFRHADYAAGDIFHLLSDGIDDAKARLTGARVNAQDLCHRDECALLMWGGSVTWSGACRKRKSRCS